MPANVVVLVDAQNVYKDAREQFFVPGASHVLGQFDPLELGKLIATRRPTGSEKEDRQLLEVRVYSGSPSPAKDPKSYAAHRRQRAAWETSGVLCSLRPLRYPREYPALPPQQKGVDVSLAIDLVVLALDGVCDVLVVVSTDTDLMPAIEVAGTRGKAKVEVACWWNGIKKPLRLAGGHLWCHRLVRDDYDLVADRRDYNLP